MVHSWNLFEVAVTPDGASTSRKGDVISFGLLNLSDALMRGTEDFLSKLLQNATLQSGPRARYNGRFIWPKVKSGVVQLSRAQLSMLLEGIDWRRVEHTWTPEVAV